ncbi:MAG: hypothetical protein AABM43_12130 [Actinomycetota bacterium]
MRRVRSDIAKPPDPRSLDRLPEVLVEAALNSRSLTIAGDGTGLNSLDAIGVELRELGQVIDRKLDRPAALP